MVRGFRAGKEICQKMSRKLRIPSGNPKPYTTFKYDLDRMVPETVLLMSTALARVKSVVLREGIPFDMDVTSGVNTMVVFTFETSRQWMDLLLKVMDRDKRRKHNWVSTKPAVIGEWVWKELNSPWNRIKIKARAPVDNTLPAEGSMNEKEMRIIYGH